MLTVSTPFGNSIGGSVVQQMAHRSRCRPAVQDVEHVANASNGGRDRSPVAVHAPHWDNGQPLTNWYRDQLMAKIEELHHPRHAQLRKARVPTLVKALQELGFDPSAEHNGGNNQKHGEQSVSARAPPDTLEPVQTLSVCLSVSLSYKFSYKGILTVHKLPYDTI